MSSGVYIISCKNNVYVGCSRDIDRRWYEHRRELRLGKHHSKGLQNLYNAHGPENLSYDILLYCDEGDMLYIIEKQIAESVKQAGFKLLNSVGVLGNINSRGRPRVFEDAEITKLWEEIGTIKGIMRATGRSRNAVRTHVRRLNLMPTTK